VYWSFVYDAVSWFSEWISCDFNVSWFTIMNIYLVYRTIYIYIADLYNCMLRCSFVPSTDVMLYLIVLLGMD
jgi:hypothetical protein